MLRWGILGTSFISNTVAAAIRRSPGSAIVAAAGRDAERTESFRERLAIGKAYTDYDALLADPEIDIVYVGLPNHVHHEWVAKAAEAGKAVLSEKSLSVDMAKSRAMIDAVDANGVFFVEGLMYLAHPIIARFVEVLQAGRIGGLRSVHATYAADIWQLVNPEGRGAIFNLGCYPVSLLHLAVQTACGEEAFSSRHSFATGSLSAHDGNVSEAALAVRFGNGVLATVQTAETYGMHAEFTVLGETGSISFAQNPWLPAAGTSELIVTGYDGKREVIEVESDGDAFLHQVRMIERSLAKGRLQAERPSPGWIDSLEIMSMLTEWEAEILDRDD